jgi:hypothetical protein
MCIMAVKLLFVEMYILLVLVRGKVDI